MEFTFCWVIKPLFLSRRGNEESSSLQDLSRRDIVPVKLQLCISKTVRMHVEFRFFEWLTLLFIIVLEVLSREFREGLLMELLYAHDLVLMAESKELLIEKLRKWKRGMEAKGFRVNAGKTKIMQCRASRVQSEDSEKHPCGVCREGFESNSILFVSDGFIKDVVASRGS